jgi:hypothetical protein
MAWNVPSWLLWLGIGGGVVYFATKKSSASAGGKALTDASPADILAILTESGAAASCTECNTAIGQMGVKAIVLSGDCTPCKQKILEALQAKGYNVDNFEQLIMTMGA